MVRWMLCHLYQAQWHWTDRANSFVGTAQYVSPELLSEKTACKRLSFRSLPSCATDTDGSSDLWALGCIIYQLLAGAVPFRAMNEYQTFKKIAALDYEIPDGFPPKAKVAFVINRCEQP